MIGRLSGTLIAKKPPELLVDVGGVGYEVLASMNTIYQLPEPNKPVVLLTHFIVREDAQLLYGFFDETERQIFRQLIKISGLGPKLALALLSGLSTHELIECVEQNDTARLIKIPGIGKKTAERLMLEMKSKISPDLMKGGLSEVALVGQFSSSRPNAVEDAVSALIALGYKANEAHRCVSKLDQQDATSEMLIRQALKGLS